MAPAPRNSINKHGIPNLYVKKDKRSASGFSCQYKDPRFGDSRFTDVVKQWHSLGSDVELAKQRALTLNAVILKQIADAKVETILVQPQYAISTITLSEWLEKYSVKQLKKLEQGQIKPNTWRTKRNILQTIDSKHGELHLEKITPKLIAGLLSEYSEQGKGRMAQSVRSTYIDVFKSAIASGEVESGFNPAADTENPYAKVGRERLTLEQFNQISNAQEYEPHQATYLLALLTAQRRVDICLMRKKKGADWDERYSKYRRNPNHYVESENGYSGFNMLVQHAPYSFIEDDFLHVFQLKTGNLIKLPLDLKLEVVNLSVREVIDKANLFKFSPFVVHHTTKRITNEKGDPLHPDTVSRSFKKARTNTDLTWTLTPPTFHEIRSLSERLFREQGLDTKILCGHKHQKMTDVYNDNRGCDWSKVPAILS